jgi:pimeloyl-ACP methyl ester carboxylesterase
MSSMTTVLPSGRRAGLSAFGDPMADRIAIICHPTPGASGFDPDPVLTERWGLRLVGLDRPGYGSSEPSPDRAQGSLLARADDVAAFVDADERIANRISSTDLHHCGAIGWGTGAIVAAATAVRHPELIDRLVLVSPASPTKARAAAGRTLSLADGLTALGVAEDDPAFGRHLGLDRRLGRMLESSFEQGGAGLMGDRDLFAEDDWAEGLAGLETPVLVLTGALDPNVDEDDLAWWRGRLPGSAEFRRIDGSASLTISDAWESALAHVAPAHGHIESELRDRGEPRLPDLSG